MWKSRKVIEKHQSACYNETQGNLDEAVFTLQVTLEGVFPSGRKEGGIADGYIY